MMEYGIVALICVQRMGLDSHQNVHSGNISPIPMKTIFIRELIVESRGDVCIPYVSLQLDGMRNNADRSYVPESANSVVFRS
jgi:hypothetical protein